MFFKYKKLLQTTTVFLFLCLSNSYVFALKADTTEPKALLTGILNASDVQSVRVNGNIAQDGMTILSGTEIKTGNSGGAVVKLYQLGKIEMEAETSIKLIFKAQNVELQVISGQAILTTYKGVEGKLSDTNGKVLTTDSTLEVSIVSNREISSAAALSPETSVSTNGLFGFAMWGTLGIAAGSVAAWVVVTSMDNASQRPISSVQP